jgi:hypothetical protein
MIPAEKHIFALASGKYLWINEGYSLYRILR